MEREIRATHNADGVAIYQAFKPSIADEALRIGTFGKGFGLERWTWIKPSFGWMLYRSHYATRHRQTRILRIWIRHEGFRTILSKAVPTSHDPRLFPDPDAWRAAVRRAEVHYQWDPDRNCRLQRLERRALQLGLKGTVVAEYVHSWIIRIEDATDLARSIKGAIDTGGKVPVCPEEPVYYVDPELRRILGM